MKESLEQIQKRYKLSEKENRAIFEIIKERMLLNKEPENNPTAIINIAPPGSGKTGLNGFSVKQFSNNNVVIVNSDELKQFHPKTDEIARLYPEYYARIINQDSNPWTDDLFEYAVNHNYNVIFEGTGRNLKLLNKMISKMPNHKIIVRGMAVNELNCLMSIVERYEGQVEVKGWGRLVSRETFYKAYSEMLDTIESLEMKEGIDTVEVYKRGENPTDPIIIYRSNDETKKFLNAKYAVISGRLEDRKKAKEYFETYHNAMSKILKIRKLTEEENVILEKIEELYQAVLEEDSER